MLTLLIFLLFSFSAFHLRLFSGQCPLLLPSWDLVSSLSSPSRWTVNCSPSCIFPDVGVHSPLSAAHQILIVLHPLDAVLPFVPRQFLLSLATSLVHCCVLSLCDAVSFPWFFYCSVSQGITLSHFISFR